MCSAIAAVDDSELLGRWSELGACPGRAADAVLEWPFRPPGVPGRIEGREKVRAFHRGSLVVNRLRYVHVDVAAHDTQDPELIITEMAMEGTDSETGALFRLRAIALMRVQGGGIVSYRDYVDPLAAPRIMGRLPELFAALGADESGAT